MTLTILKILPFALLMLAFLFGGHYFIYRSFVRFFNIENSLLKNALLAVLSVLAVSFFISSAIAHNSQTPAAKYFYIITATWLGVALNLLIASCAIWLIHWLLNLAGIDLNKALLAGFFFSLAAIISAYGAWNALNPKINNINIAIKNLPAQWKGKKVAQLSDLHLGHIHGEKFLQDVVDKTNSQNPDLILITGDLFDGMDGDLSVFTKPLNSLRSANGVFFVTGNHEFYIGMDRALDALKQTNIKILNNEVVDLNGLQIIGISYPSADNSAGMVGRLNDAAGLLNSLSGFDKNKPSILMCHAPTNTMEAAAAGISLQLSGHTHRGQTWPFEFFTRLIYGQYYYGLHVIGDFSIYTTSGIGTWGPPMRTTGTPEIPIFKLQSS